MSAWALKPCAGCDGRKGPKYIDKKYCGKCAPAVRRASREAAHRASVARTYGIGRDGYDLLYAAQGGTCAICQRATGRTRRLSVDHDHVTGEVRGLLCRPCNDMLGHARDNYRMFVRAASYLLTPPARPVLVAPVGEPAPGADRGSAATTGGA